jgi:hypothetical protein
MLPAADLAPALASSAKDAALPFTSPAVAAERPLRSEVPALAALAASSADSLAWYLAFSRWPSAWGRGRKGVYTDRGEVVDSSEGKLLRRKECEVLVVPGHFQLTAVIEGQCEAGSCGTSYAHIAACKCIQARPVVATPSPRYYAAGSLMHACRMNGFKPSHNAHAPSHPCTTMMNYGQCIAGP